MDIIRLQEIVPFFKGTQDDLKRILQLASMDMSEFSQNDFEFLIHDMIERKYLSFHNYMDIRYEFSRLNPNVVYFELDNRVFNFAIKTYLNASCKDLQKPSKKLDKDYNGEYDFWLNGIKIEVKASRVVDNQSNEPLYRKALSKNTKRPFLMNFQQLKPQCCDVFVWLAVFSDEIVIWVMSSKEVQNHPDYSKGQHRGNKGNEGQLHIKETNISTLKKYKFTGKNLKTAIQKAAKRN